MIIIKKYKKIFLIIAIISTLTFISWATVRIIKTIQFDFECKAYLKRAADSNTIELAKGELKKAIDYAKEKDLTTGIVSIFLKNPANDIGFWYHNMNLAYEELDSISDNASSLEKTNVLMKLRESLTDSDSSGATSVIIPDGITVYPNNMLYFLWALLSLILTIIFWILFLKSLGIKITSNEISTKKKIILKKSEETKK